ncbi:tannase/feruloyl esterase family alpha/beta hydrolase [Actinomadura parmotrematis]|uniref:Tannase/feruloyl esterase family alpha/beta hydrolase n=1 Tax=Actinomadura parmotrematis TaxID=2864039 RepID=A0ABS7FZ28_9ACTN|nr:tannase/feruloyl esterase family alpha/beta hydrolase [Actinomadura parmotrematis]MBW8484827.1 tannase/feruloyl esterase family alpha/beta hydrolase [Actinomadura parmotrematis]
MTAVPGAARQVSARLPDLITAGLAAGRHTEPDDWAWLHAAGTRNPSGVPGVQIDGHFPSATRLNPFHGWDRDAQFVLRLPDAWNGGLVVTGAPGVRRQYAPDVLIGDWALARGYAYACTDKGNSGPEFFTAGGAPGDAIAEWHRRTTQLAEAAAQTVAAHYGGAPRRVYMAGISNGGYLTRWQLENRPDLYDGGVDWEGPFWRAEGPNLLTHLPAVLRHYPQWRDGRSEEALAGMEKAGLPAASEFLWEAHDQVYWEFTQRTYRAVFDPGYSGAEADYDYAARPASVREGVERISLTGAIGRPLLSLHGTLDALLPISLHADPYAALVRAAGHGGLHRLYRIEGGNHVDGYHDLFPGRVRPLLPVFRAVFEALERWVEDGAAPPASATFPLPVEGDLVNNFTW